MMHGEAAPLKTYTIIHEIQNSPFIPHGAPFLTDHITVFASFSSVTTDFYFFTIANSLWFPFMSTQYGNALTDS